MANSTSLTAPPPPEPLAVIWGDFTLTEEDIAELRSALHADCPASRFTDDEVRQMAYDTINFIALVVELQKTQTAA